MYGVDFDDSDNEFELKSRKILGDPVTPSMITTLKKVGFVKKDSQALTFLILVVLGCCAGVYYFLSPGENKTGVVTSSGDTVSIEIYTSSLEKGIDLRE